MKFSHTPLARACTLALGLTLLHGCDSNGEFSGVSNVAQSSGDQGFVDLSSQQTSSSDDGNSTGSPTNPDTGSGGSGTGGDSGGGDNSGGDNGTGDGGDNSGGDNSTGDGGDNSGGDNGTGDGGDNSGGDNGTGDGGDNSGGDNGTGDGGDNSGGDNGTGDGGDNSGGDNSTGDGGDNSGGDNGTGDGGNNSGSDNSTGDGGDNSGGDCANDNCALGTPSRALAISVLEYSTSHANLARFAEALANNGASAGSYQCIDGGTATFSSESRSDNHSIPTWAFTNCQLPADSDTSLIYNGHLSSVCTRTNRTSNDAAMECTAAFNNLRVTSDAHAAAINGAVALSIEGESLREDSAGLSTTTALDTWTSPSQTIASQGGELRGLNIRVDTLADNLALTILGQGDFRLSATGCLLSGDVLVGDFYSDATISITGQSGGNMLLNTVATTETIACSEISALPYTAPQFR